MILSPQERFQALDAAGLSGPQIADRLGVHERTVSRWRARAGRQKRPATIPTPQSRRDLAWRLIEDGCPVAEAARTVGVAPRTVRGWFPHAPSLTPSQAGHIAVLNRYARNVIEGV